MARLPSTELTLMESSDPSRNAKESLDLAYQMSQLLSTGVDRYTLSLLIALCERGVNPEALSALVREISTAPPPPPLSSSFSANGSVSESRSGSSGFVSTNGSASLHASTTGTSSFRSSFGQY